MSHDRLTCLVPTHNRPHFLRRLWQFYVQFPLPCSFFVADSSHPEAAAENLASINRARGTLEITYRHFGEDAAAKSCRALEFIRTPHVVFCADDDYLFPAMIERCLSVLENHPDVSVAIGVQVNMDCQKRGFPCRAGAGYPILNDDPIERVRQMATYPFSTFYGIRRTEELQAEFDYVIRNLSTDRSYFFPEVMLLLLSALKGKVQVLPGVHTVRELHAAASRHRPKAFGVGNGSALYEQFCDQLASRLAEFGMNREAADQFVSRRYGYLLDSGLEKSDRKKLSWRRVECFLRRAKRDVLNLFVRDGIMHRRAVRPADVAGQEAEWQEATRLMSTWPDGIPLAEEQQRLAG